MQVKEAKSSGKNLVKQRCAEGFNSEVKGSIFDWNKQKLKIADVIIRDALCSLMFKVSIIKFYVYKFHVLWD
jgi:hypothetical protein